MEPAVTPLDPRGDRAAGHPVDRSVEHPVDRAAVRADAQAAERAPVEVPLRRLDPDLPLPAYAHPGDAGADLVSAVDVVLGPGERAVVPTGVAVALPEGYAAFVHPRSGLAARHGLTIVNAPGTVDAGYRGEVVVTLLNTDRSATVRLVRGERIAQVVVQRVERVRFRPVDELPPSRRGEGRHGSTGTTRVLSEETTW